MDRRTIIALLGAVALSGTVGQAQAASVSVRGTEVPKGGEFTLEKLQAGSVRIEGSLPTPGEKRIRKVPTLSAKAAAGELLRASGSKPEVASYTGYRLISAVGKSSASGPAGIVNVDTIADGYMAAATMRYVDLSWTPPKETASKKNPKKFVILRDGAPIATVSSLKFRDRSVRPGTPYRYQVQGVAPPSELDPRQATAEKPVTRGLEYGFSVQTPSSEAATQVGRTVASLNAATSVEQTGTVRLRAFIPEKTIELNRATAQLCKGYKRFSGDDRRFTPYVKASSRVADDAVIHWPTKKVYHKPVVGKTKALDYRGRVVAWKIAEFEGGVTYGGATNSKVQFTQSIKARNPFCVSAAGYAFATQTIDITRSGNYKTTGWAKKMPNVEIYYIYAASSTRYHGWTILQNPHWRPECLVDYVPFCTINFTRKGP